MSPELTRDDFHILFLQGEEAVFALFEQFQARLTALEEQVAKNSGNSSKPPSSDGLSKKPLAPMTTSLRKKSGKRVGGQTGHVGSTLEQVAEPDTIVLHRPTCCPDCQTDLSSVPVTPNTVCRRQVFEMPEPKVVVTEHQAACVTCPGCGKPCRGSFPAGVAQPVQYGPNLLGFATYLHAVHLLPFARCAAVVREVTSAPFSAGSLARALEVAHQALESFEVSVKAALSHTPIQHVDETGSRVAGKLHWFHVRCTPQMTYLFRHEKRGGSATEDLADYEGTLVSDFWSSYVKLSKCQHVFCGAHLLRELTFQHQVKKQAWAEKLILLLEDAAGACHAARARGAAKVWDAPRFAAEYDQAVQEGLQANPPPETGKAGKACCLLERLQRRKDDCLRFLKDLSLPFTNNQAERDLRMLKVKAKVSGTFRTTTGADRHARLRSYIQTCNKQRMPLLDALRQLFQKQLVMPALKAE